MADRNQQQSRFLILNSILVRVTQIVTEKLVKEVSEDLIKVVVDRVNDKKCDTGKFRRIYKAKSILDKPNSVGLNLCLEGKKIKKVKG